ncbi:hypothetical protein C8Q76DRAFT_430477 [Earliella scabrosa]|nr:hypothetical protein C8Q76DRAFT_430477 [Earliella scabrosa]
MSRWIRCLYLTLMRLQSSAKRNSSCSLALGSPRTSTMMTLNSLPVDILCLICAHCDSDALKALATTCQTVSDPALRTLWCSLQSFGLLIYTLPPDAWRCVEEVADSQVQVERHTLYILRELTKADFVRWGMYSSFVKSVGEVVLEFVRAFYIDRSSWDVLERSIPSPLPNLRRVHYSHMFLNALHLRYVEPIQIFFGPALHELFIVLSQENMLQGEDHANAIIRLIEDLPRRSPNLTEYKFKGYTRSEGLDDAMYNLVRQRGKLRSFCVSFAIKPRTLLQLSSSATLHELELDLYSRDYVHERYHYSSYTFPSLRDLTVHTNDVDLLCTLLGDVQSTQLQHVYISMSNTVSSDTFHHLASVLGHHPSRSSITKLRMSFGRTSPTEDARASQPIHENAIAPLHSLRAVTSVVLNGRNYPFLGDEALCQLAEAWPSIVTLWLNPTEGHSTEVTLAGLACFVGRCPKLTHLGLALADIEADAVPAASSPDPRVPSCEMEVLVVGRPSVGEAQVVRVASLLSAWFPKLYFVNSDWLGPWHRRSEGLDAHVRQMERQMLVRWREIGKLVVALAKVRRQERHSRGLRM